MTEPGEHPSPELLAELVSGTLSTEERTAMLAHLQSCVRCAQEVAQASGSRRALAQLQDVEPPAGIGDRALAEAGGRPIGRPAAPDWYRWGGIAAAVAVFALLLTLVLPKVGGGGSSDRAGSAPEVGAATQGSPVLIEISPTNFGSGSLTRLADSHATAAGPEIATPAASQGTTAQTVAATDCIHTAFRQVDGTLVRLIQAQFKGQKAYVALYEESPGAGQPADAVTIRVAAASDCSPLSLAQAPIPASP